MIFNKDSGKHFEMVILDQEKVHDQSLEASQDLQEHMMLSATLPQQIFKPEYFASQDFESKFQQCDMFFFPVLIIRQQKRQRQIYLAASEVYQSSTAITIWKHIDPV